MAQRTALILLAAVVGLSAAQAQRVLDSPGVSCDSGSCEMTWQKCAGKGLSGVSPCCPGDICVQKSMYYSQCRPESYPIPAGWGGSILECGTGMYGEGTLGTYGPEEEVAGAGTGGSSLPGSGTAGAGTYGGTLGATDGAMYGGELPGTYGF